MFSSDARTASRVAIAACADGGFADSAATPTMRVDAAQWCRREFDFWAFDRSCESATPLVIEVTGANADVVAQQIALRAQRVSPRCNATDEWRRVLETHRALHDLSLPLVVADYAHALDAWQWTLRIDPHASPALQYAALFHDVERLNSEAAARVEQHAHDYAAFKNAHAAAGAELCRSVLREAGVDEVAARRASQLVASSEERDQSDESAVLNDADALSFLSLNSPGFFDYFDREHCLKKVRYTLARIRPQSLHYVDHIGLRDDVAEVVHLERRSLAR